MLVHACLSIGLCVQSCRLEVRVRYFAKILLIVKFLRCFVRVQMRHKIRQQNTSSTMMSCVVR